MSGYKRVNFYELCRLCATNQQKEKTHIFQEEGRKIQLQNKIQSCLSLKVCENDFLPKVVCSQCLRTLEECCLFRKECFSSETMLSSYFNNFRYTDDFKKSGKVYIKDTSPKVIVPQATPDNSVMPAATTNTSYNVNILPNPSVSNGIGQETLPYYTLHLPTVVPQPPEPKTPKDQKIITQPQIIYNLNTIKTVIPSLPKPNITEPVNNIALNSNGEILTIAPLLDVDTYMTQAVQKCIRKIQKKPKTVDMLGKNLDESNVIKIDLTDFNFKEKLKTQQKYYTDAKSTLVMNSLDLNVPTVNRDLNLNTNVILNSTPRLNPVTNLNINRSTTQKLVNFNNANVCTSNNTLDISNINAPTDVINLNAEPPPVINSNLNLPTPAYNTTHYSVNASKQDVHTNMNDLFNSSSVLRNVTMQNYSPVALTNQSATFQCNKEQETPVKKHSCDICCKTFKRREHLYQHMKLHTGFRPFTCENCNKSFLRKEHLLRHMVAHSGQKNYTCSICEKSFSRNDNLLKHKKIHNKQNSFTCEVCQKQFVMEHYYFAHKRTHDNEKCINQVWGLLKAV